MKRTVCLSLLAACGCSTAPLTNMMDRFNPSRVEPVLKERSDGPSPPGVYPEDKGGTRLGEPFPVPDPAKPLPRY